MREEFVKKLQNKGVAKNPRVAAALKDINRADFMITGDPEQDEPQKIYAGQTISQPYTVAFMLDILDLEPGQKILDVGSGSGWTTTLLAHITGEEGSVIGVEIEPELISFGQKNLEKYQFEFAKITESNKNTYGAPEYAPYDRILISAEATESAIKILSKQLKPNGVLVGPIGDEIIKITKEKRETWKGFKFVPLKKI